MWFIFWRKNDGIWFNYERLLLQNLVCQFYLHVLT
jgi:hypothetical protein